ncbi:RNA 2',3'-cyclic phosphodiesterase [Candidatus Parcubacteria bacterium]|nr:RNA 2',3'-cyclic phosphodiesterase [Patescibacteria group bacterium]MCG2693796.1 RNA 2',3'-cyclic phosphodiesterase [Candidatus Parcubacteria bacterium]
MKRRVFLAINLPKEIDKKISIYCLKLAKRLPKEGIKFVKEGSRHITLYFLGSQTEQKIDKVSLLMENVAKKYTGFEIATKKITAFPNEKFPRIIVLGAEGRGEEIKKIRATLGDDLQKIGIETDTRPWEAHITLARIKFGKVNFARIQKEAEIDANWVVDSFDLVESELTAEGLVYKIIKKFPLRF